MLRAASICMHRGLPSWCFRIVQALLSDACKIFLGFVRPLMLLSAWKEPLTPLTAIKFQQNLLNCGAHHHNASNTVAPLVPLTGNGPWFICASPPNTNTYACIAMISHLSSPAVASSGTYYHCYGCWVLAEPARNPCMMHTNGR
jgi:hypothetical protein